MDPLPVVHVICAVLVQMGELINITVLFPFLIFLVEDFGYSGTEVGLYSGVLAASFCSAQFVSSFWWGWISDKYGRKPAILFGLMGTGIGMLIFGFATTYQQAILGRIIPGLLSGNGGVMKSFVTEVTTDSNRAKAFSYLSFGVATGAIVGPLIGGYLSFSSEKYPHVFPPSQVGAYPALLPALCCCAITMSTLLFCLVTMQETCPNVISTKFMKMESETRDGTVDVEMGAASGGTSDRPVLPETASSPPSEELHDDVVRVRAMTNESLPDVSNPLHANGSNYDQIDGMMAVDVDMPKKDTCTVFRDIPVLLATSNYGLLCFSFILMDETIPFLMRSSVQEGGMDMTSSSIGFVLSVAGLPMLLFVLFFLARVVAGSKLRVFRIFATGTIFITALWPIVGVVYKEEGTTTAGARTILTTCVILLATMKHIFSTVCFTSAIVMVNNSVENKHLGLANGFGQSLASAARALGPLIGGIGWSLGLSVGFVYLNFVFIILMFFCNIGLSLLLPSSIDNKKKSIKELADNDSY